MLYNAKERYYSAVTEEIGQKEGEYIRQYRPVLNTQIPREDDWRKFDVCAVDGWHDIVAISTADETTMGLRSNGAVVIAGINFAEAPDWTDIALPE